jgi:hypothetical protein
MVPVTYCLFNRSFLKKQRWLSFCEKFRVPQNTATSSILLGQRVRKRLILYVTDVELQAGDEVNLPVTVHANSFLSLATGSILKQHGRPPR